MSITIRVGGNITETTKGDVNIYAKGSITYSSNVQVINTAPEIIYGEAEPFPGEVIGSTIIQFRPIIANDEKTGTKAIYKGKEYPIYNGEYGFDWYQYNEELPERGKITIDDVLLTGEKSAVQGNKIYNGPYGRQNEYGTIKTLYKDKEEALTAFRATYKKMHLSRKYVQSPDGFYYVPYLALFSKDVSKKEEERKKGIKGFVSPPYRASLRMCIDLEGTKPEKLEIKGNPHFRINGREERENYIFDFSKLKIEHGDIQNELLDLECTRSFSQIQEINIYAHYKDKTTPEPAGRLLVIPNSEEYIHTIKLAFITTEMDVTNIGAAQQIGKLSAENIGQFYYLYQALCLYDWEDVTLDLTRHSHFKINSLSRYVLRQGNDMVLNNKIISVRDFIGLLVKIQDKEGNYPYQKYIEEDRIIIFFLGMNFVKSILLGFHTEETNGILMSLKGSTTKVTNNTMAHETLHAAGLPHTFFDFYPKNGRQVLENTEFLHRKNKKFVFEDKKTTNIMDYSDTNYNSFSWQWKVINPKLKF